MGGVVVLVAVVMATFDAMPDPPQEPRSLYAVPALRGDGGEALSSAVPVPDLQSGGEACPMTPAAECRAAADRHPVAQKP